VCSSASNVPPGEIGRFEETPRFPEIAPENVPVLIIFYKVTELHKLGLELR
jgi:hypothetical protein